MKKDPDTRITRGTKNVFADLGFPDAETHLLKAELVTRIQGVITAQGLTQVAAAKRMGLSQPRFAAAQWAVARCAGRTLDASAYATRLRRRYHHP